MEVAPVLVLGLEVEYAEPVASGTLTVAVEVLSRWASGELGLGACVLDVVDVVVLGLVGLVELTDTCDGFVLDVVSPEPQAASVRVDEAARAQASNDERMQSIVAIDRLARPAHSSHHRGMSRSRIVALSATLLVAPSLAACGSSTDATSTKSTRVVDASKPATSSASPFTLPDATQSKDADKPLPSASATGSGASVPPPTVVAAPTVTKTVKPSASPSASSTSKSSAPSSAAPATSAAPTTPSTMDAKHDQLVISKMALSTSLVSLGATGSNSIQPQRGAVGWYSGSAKPGSVGTSVLIGYADDPTFAQFSKLAVGDSIRAGGTDYRVSKIAKRSASALQTDQDVWGANTSTKKLALISVDDVGNATLATAVAR